MARYVIPQSETNTASSMTVISGSTSTDAHSTEVQVPSTPQVFPPDVAQALLTRTGRLDAVMLRRVIEAEAAAIGLTLDEAIARAKANILPASPMGVDIEFLIDISEPE
jgi:hypothetical protein